MDLPHLHQINPLAPAVQMIAHRYGAVPVVRLTGGLVDTVTDVDSGEQHCHLLLGQVVGLHMNRVPCCRAGTPLELLVDDVVQREEHCAALLQALSRAMATALTAWMRDP